MPRSPRPDAPGTWHHLMNRGADRQDIFSDDHCYVKFESLLGEAVDRFGIEVHAYCLMTNHFHLLVHCPNAGLSESMQSVLFRYAQWYNARHGRDGPLFRGRFLSAVVAGDGQLLQVGRYIHRNPLAFVPLPALAAYRWSSLGCYLGRRTAPPWLTVEGLLAPFGFDLERFWTNICTAQPSDRIGSVSMPAVGRPTCPEIDSAISAVTGVDVATIRHGRQGAVNLPRTMAVMLGVEYRAASSSELADRYDLSNPGSVRNTARRGRVLAAADPAFGRFRLRVVDELATWCVGA